jgi:hypothetical protein
MQPLWHEDNGQGHRNYGGDRQQGYDRNHGGDRQQGYDRNHGGDRQQGYDRNYGGDRQQGYDRNYGGDRQQGYDRSVFSFYYSCLIVFCIVYFAYAHLTGWNYGLCGLACSINICLEFFYWVAGHLR